MSLDLVVAPRIVLHHHKHCTRMYQGALPSSRLRYLNKAVSSQIYKKYNWQHTSIELAICTAHVKGCRAGPGVLLHALYHCAHCSCAGENNVILTDLNLAVSTPTVKPLFNSSSNFLAIQYCVFWVEK